MGKNGRGGIHIVDHSGTGVFGALFFGAGGFGISRLQCDSGAGGAGVGDGPGADCKIPLVFDKEGPVLLVTAGDAKVDNTKYKAMFHEKARMVPFDEVEAVIGHAAGGVCPFAVRPEVRVYLDCALQRFETVYPACGSANSAIALFRRVLLR